MSTSSSPTWAPDCLHRFLGFATGTPSVKALAGYHMLRVLLALSAVHSGVIFAGVITYEALRITDCLPEETDDSNSGECSSSSSSTDPDCRQLWGLFRADSLLTVIATAAAVCLALTTALVGTLMDVTKYRRQIAFVGTSMMIIGTLLCLSIYTPTSTTLIICSIGLFCAYYFKDIHSMANESYAPELSPDPHEVAVAISSGALWLYVTEIVAIIAMILVGFGVPESSYGFVVTVILGVVMLICLPITYSRLPNVPAAKPLPENTTITKFTFQRLKLLLSTTYSHYWDLGLVLLANMIFDPALSTIFVAAVLVLVSKYHFSTTDIPVILGCGILSAVAGAYISQKVVTKHDETEEGGNTARSNDSTVLTNPPSDPETAAIPVSPATIATKSACSYRMKYSLIGFLLFTTVVTATSPYVLLPCNLPLACLYAVFWGIGLSSCWNASTMLRSSLVPGGCEAEFAGLTYVSFNTLQWLPLLVFSIANEIWSIDAAMLLLNIFFVIGAAVLGCVDIGRGLEARSKTLEARRWLHLAEKNTESGVELLNGAAKC